MKKYDTNVTFLLRYIIIKYNRKYTFTSTKVVVANWHKQLQSKFKF